VLVLLILGLILIAAFVVWEIKYPYAMIDMKIWYDRDFSLVSFLAVYFSTINTITTEEKFHNPLTHTSNTAPHHPLLWLPRFSYLLLLDRTLLPNSAELQRPHDRRTHAPHGNRRSNRQRRRRPRSTQSLQQTARGHRCGRTNRFLHSRCRTEVRRLVLGVFFPGAVFVCYWGGFPVHCR